MMGGLFGRRVNRNPLEAVSQDMPTGGAMQAYGAMDAGQGAQASSGKPGFFDRGGIGQYALAGISDFIDRRQGDQPTAIPNMMAAQFAQEQQAAALRQKALEAAQENAQWYERKQWERDNPMPANNDTVNDVNWWMQASPEERAAFHEMNPEYRQGPDGRFYRVEVGGGNAPTAPVGRLTPIQPTTQNTPAPQLGASGLPAALTPDQYQAVVSVRGKSETDAWMRRHNIRVTN